MKNSVLSLFIFIGFISSSCITIELGKDELYRPVKEYALDSNFTFQRKYVKVTDTSRIETWIMKQPDARVNIVFFNGNGSNIRSSIPTFNALGSEAGANIFAANYSGYGRSEGKPTLPGIVRDGKKALTFFEKEMDTSLTTYVMGYSLGGHVALHLTGEKSVGGTILLATFTNAKEVEDHVMKELVPGAARLFLRVKLDTIAQQLDNRKLIEQNRKPVFLAHGKADDFLPPWMSTALMEATPAMKKKVFLVEDGDHRTVLKDPEQAKAIAREIADFIFKK
jgi:pimeloyl-ACP methyl ester carboxylesterase